jgi:general secretion pathway protein H
MGSLFSLALLSNSSSGQQRALRTEADRLVALIGLLADQAVLDGREYGLLLDSESYRVLGYEESTGLWQPLTEEREYRLPAWVQLELELDGQPLPLVGAAGSSEEREGAASPQLMILSSGELSPFRLHLRARNGRASAFRLDSDGFQLPRVDVVAGTQ